MEHIIFYEMMSRLDSNQVLQPWPELLKMTYFVPPPPPDTMLMSGIQVIFGRLNIAWGKGGKRNGLLKQHCQPFLRGGFRV